MSYSRWGLSHWYIYWSTKSGDLISTQILSCIFNKNRMPSHFTYTELKIDREKCFFSITEADERETFDRCVDEWLKDVEEEFSQPQ